ncbi:MAG TPA: 2,3-epoxybenzoyl-CoA dihydrolase [Streptosporangiaceae bacterium]|nr:2,3-epoxybenzoyl-CoA dihydrolase [Streptosporangiaceae bacterium]
MTVAAAGGAPAASTGAASATTSPTTSPTANTATSPTANTATSTGATSTGGSTGAPSSAETAQPPVVDFDTQPSRYRHWQLRVDGQAARLSLDVDEQGGLTPGYELKLNSYDLGVDIEFYDAVQRLRFEHPQVRAVVVTSAKDRMFCAGANIRMLAQSPHAWKVNFCKFTNETRNAVEDASAHSGQTWIAALNGATAGGGYEMALACDEILLVDDGSAAVALPEVPLLGVLPATGGLTRMVDKRGVRRDVADVLATKAEGVCGQTAADWGLVDAVAPPRQFEQAVAARVSDAIERSARPADAIGIELTPLRRTIGPDAIRYPHVGCEIDRGLGVATITVDGPRAIPASPGELHDQGADGWLLAVTRELDDLILRLRVNELEIGIWVLKTAGDPAAVAAYDEFMLGSRGDWLADEILHYYKRTIKRLDVTSRSLFALIEPGSCFSGSLAELALAADRSYLLDGLRPEDSSAGHAAATLQLGAMNTGPLPMANGLSRLACRFWGHEAELAAVQRLVGVPLGAARAVAAGLVTFTFDDIDWDEELRIALEERASFSPDALTAMEAQNRFAGPETLETKIFGRLSAWQNWIFQRPNAAGPEGALRRYGTGQRPAYDRRRV